MKLNPYASKFIDASSRTSGVARFVTFSVIVAGLVLLGAHSASAGLAFLRGNVTAVGVDQFASSPDSAIVTGAFTAPGFIANGLFTPINRIQYDIINSDQGPLYSWTLNYTAAVGPFIIGAATPIGYVTPTGAFVPEGGSAYTTLFTAGYGIYNYNTGAPWIIDYEADHITFSSAIAGAFALPPADGVGLLAPTSYLPSFAIDYDPSLTHGPVPATVVVGSATGNGLVTGPIAPTATTCITLQCSNVVAFTCDPCTSVAYNVKVVDNCCSNVIVQYFPPSTQCFPKNSTNVVEVVATDACGNGATNYFTVKVLSGPSCTPTNPCISILCSNIVVYSCSSCTPVAYTATATDTCCPAGAVSLVYNPPPGFCFPLGSTIPVQVKANDQCGNTATSSFTVTVLPGNCSSNGCISLQTSNLVVYTCSNSAPVTFPAQYTDRCCSNSTVFFSPPSGTVFPLGTTSVVATVSDQCGNRFSQTFTVTVIKSSNPPVINCPASIVLACAPGTSFAVMPDETSNPALIAGNLEPVSVSQSIPPGTGVSGMTYVTLTVANGCGETVSCTVPVYALPDPALSRGTNSSGTSNFTMVSWPPAPAQLQLSPDLRHWALIAGATNSPYLITNGPPTNAFFRLQFNFPTNVTTNHP